MPASDSHFEEVSGNFIKEEAMSQVFFCEFCKNFKKTFFTEHLRGGDCFCT